MRSAIRTHIYSGVLPLSEKQKYINLLCINSCFSFSKLSVQKPPIALLDIIKYGSVLFMDALVC